MNKNLVNLICSFIPSKEKRHKFRKKYIKNDSNIIKNDSNIIKNDLKEILFNLNIKSNNIKTKDIFKYQNINYINNYNCPNYLKYLLKNQNIIHNKDNIDNLYPCIIWNINVNYINFNVLKDIINNNNQLFIFEDGFFRSIVTSFTTDLSINKKYKTGISFTIDTKTTYFDCTKQSDLELLLNSDLIISDEQKQRARNIIDKIIKTKLSKYNSQPIYKPEIGKEGKKKVLVIDQSYGDFSIVKGSANDNTFNIMLETAIKENPDADIIIKTHPDTIAGGRACYYGDIKQKNNIYKQTEAINPLSLIDIADKVYVCTTQFGFEALMMGKEVHTFGIPFYANWGLTIDAQKCERRTKTRNFEEMFYIVYIMYSHYVNPKTQSKCEIEDAIDYLLELRSEYFKEFNIKC